MAKQPSISEAYALLGLEQGASIDEVRSAYKQLALRTHPDKNPGNVEATAKFQRISEAYTVLQASEFEPLDPWSCGRMYHGDDDCDSYFDDEEEEEEEEFYFYDEDYESDMERLRFFRFVFEEVLKGRTGRGYGRTQDPHRRPPWKTPETQEEYEARLKNMREEREQADTRRVRQKAERGAFEARMREKERKEIEERQRLKAAARKAEAESQRKKAAERAQFQLQRAQNLRSATFAAARAGEVSKVKKGVWEDEVDPAGGEIKKGCENYVAVYPPDPMETLSHIAAQKGDTDLVKWLDAHSADPEERNLLGLSAFHTALQHGHVQIIKYFFESYDPKQEEHNAIYNVSPPGSLLSVALDSAEPEVVWVILDMGLATIRDIGSAWTAVTSLEGKKSLLNKMGSDSMKYTEIQNLLMSYGGFTPPPTPKVLASTAQPVNGSPVSGKGSWHSGKSGTHYLRTTHHTVGSQHSSNEPPQTQDSIAHSPSQSPRNEERGKARGRVRGRSRDYGRGRDRGRAN